MITDYFCEFICSDMGVIFHKNSNDVISSTNEIIEASPQSPIIPRRKKNRQVS